VVALVSIMTIEALRSVLRISAQIREHYDASRLSNPATEGTPLPTVDIKDGSMVDLSSSLGEPALIVVIDASCGPADEIVRHLGVEHWQRRLKCIVVAVGRKLPPGCDGLPRWTSLVHDEYRRSQVMWHITTTPTVIIVARDGRVVHRSEGGNGVRMEAVWEQLDAARSRA
jgi:hypothetical protein